MNRICGFMVQNTISPKLVPWTFSSSSEKIMEVSLLPFRQGHVFILARPQGFELVTPPLDGMILPGVTHDSVLTLAREHSSNSNQLSGLPNDLTVSEHPVTMQDISGLVDEGHFGETRGWVKTTWSWIAVIHFPYKVYINFNRWKSSFSNWCI